MGLRLTGEHEGDAALLRGHVRLFHDTADLRLEAWGKGEEKNDTSVC